MSLSSRVIEVLTEQGISAEETVSNKIIVPDLPRAKTQKELAPKVMELNQLFINNGLRGKVKAASGGKHSDDSELQEYWILILMNFEKPAKAS